MRFIQNDDMIDALASDRSDQPFGKTILPRRGWCGRPVPDAHGAQSARDDAAIDPVAIADEVARSLILGKCLRERATHSAVGFAVTFDPDEVSAVQPDDD